MEHLSSSNRSVDRFLVSTILRISKTDNKVMRLQGIAAIVAALIVRVVV